MDFRDVSDMASDNSLDFDDLQGFLELFESPKKKTRVDLSDDALIIKKDNPQISPISESMKSILDRMSIEEIENDPILKYYTKWKKDKMSSQ